MFFWLTGSSLTKWDTLVRNTFNGTCLCFLPDGIFQDTFQSLKDVTRQILYPSLHCATFDQFVAGERHAKLPATADIVFLSVNRYEKKKQVELAIAGFGKASN